MSKRKPYVRPMEGWWKKNPFYVEYVIHESTALFVIAYAIVLLVGLVRLSQGETYWNDWLSALKSPVSIIFHLILLVAIAYHAYTWFKIMPITMPPVRLGGKKLAPGTIIAGGLTAAVVTALGLIALFGRIAA